MLSLLLQTLKDCFSVVTARGFKAVLLESRSDKRMSWVLKTMIGLRSVIIFEVMISGVCSSGGVPPPNRGDGMSKTRYRRVPHANSSVSALGKLQRSVESRLRRPVWVEISGSVLSASRKRTLAAMQNVGKMGSFRTLAATRTDDCNAGQSELSLRLRQCLFRRGNLSDDS